MFRVCEDFSGYDGPDHDAEASLQHIKDVVFATRRENPEQPLWVHTTNATDRDQIERVFDDSSLELVALFN